MLSKRANNIHFSSTIVDTHSDSLGRTVDGGEDLGQLTNTGHMDLPRMKTGNHTAQFFAAYVHPDFVPKGMAVQRVLKYTDAFRELVKKYPDQIEQAKTASDVKRISNSGKLAGILCLEGGHAIVDDLSVLREYYELGIRYMTLTHNNSNNWADGVLDQPKHNGLTQFGKEIIEEMNSIGMMVDISHVSVKTFWDTLETVSKPVIASHSSCWAICQNPRNMNDDQLVAVSKNGGVVGINFEVTFIGQQRNIEESELNQQRSEELRDLEESGKLNPEIQKTLNDKYNSLVEKLDRPNYLEIVDHIDHAVQVAGIDHVGLGSDFDGCRLPEGMDDCTRMPLITEELIKRDYSEKDIRKILGENTLRVMEEVIGQ